MSRKQVKHLLASNFMGIKDRVDRFRKPAKRTNRQNKRK